MGAAIRMFCYSLYLLTFVTYTTAYLSLASKSPKIVVGSIGLSTKKIDKPINTVTPSKINKSTDDVTPRPINRSKLTTGFPQLPNIRTECTASMEKLPEFVEKISCEHSTAFRRIVDNRTATRDEREQRLTEWAENIGKETVTQLNEHRARQYTLHERKIKKYNEVIKGVEEMIKSIDEIKTNTSLTREAEVSQVMELYNGQDKIVVEVTNLLIQLVRSTLGDRLPFRKLRPLEGIRGMWEEI